MVPFTDRKPFNEQSIISLQNQQIDSLIDSHTAVKTLSQFMLIRTDSVYLPSKM